MHINLMYEVCVYFYSFFILCHKYKAMQIASLFKQGVNCSATKV